MELVASVGAVFDEPGSELGVPLFAFMVCHARRIFRSGSKVLSYLM
ncbi:hypothetical protein P245_09625 [Comamonas thiooxydans]|uniref:Uncharacterized protein n=1 Tax=Comamonas thiooxydans TaxID=363952 RepID=A0A0E3C4K0_9BURK|nr:hypothetical protein P245_09625 [Comamonas thiooxydans]